MIDLTNLIAYSRFSEIPQGYPTVKGKQGGSGEESIDLQAITMYQAKTLFHQQSPLFSFSLFFYSVEWYIVH